MLFFVVVIIVVVVSRSFGSKEKEKSELEDRWSSRCSRLEKHVTGPSPPASWSL